MTTISKPALLLVTPNTPAKTGGGTAMRNGMFLEAYADDFDVSLLVLQIYPEGTVDWPFLRTYCKEVRVVTARDYAGNSEMLLLDAQGRRFDVMHISRLALAVTLRPFLSTDRRSASYVVLDVDDFESKRAARFAALCTIMGEEDAAARQRAYGGAMAELERKLLPYLQCLLMTHDADTAELAQLYGLQTVRTVPNAIRIPPSSPPQHDTGVPTLTFFGSLNYLPNIDGIGWFCAEVLPKLRQYSVTPFRVVVAGTRPAPRVLALACPDVSVIGHVDDVDALYAQSAIALAPLRAGAGTRIKILEAMSYVRPTVSTSIGAEGLAIPAGVGTLIADDAEAFAVTCASLLESADLRNRVASEGFDWVSKHHTIEQFKACLRMSMKSFWE